METEKIRHIVTCVAQLSLLQHFNNYYTSCFSQTTIFTLSIASVSSSYDQMATQPDPSLGDIMVAATIFYISLYSVLYFFKKFFVIYFLF